MSMTDPVADFLTRVRNAIQAAHGTVDIPASKLKKELARILQEQGYISGFDINAPTPTTPASASASSSSTPTTAARRSPACAASRVRASATTRPPTGSARSRVASAWRSSRRPVAS